MISARVVVANPACWSAPVPNLECISQLVGVKLQDQVVLEMVHHELRIRHAIQRGGHGEQVYLFHPAPGFEIHRQVWPEVTVKHPAALLDPALVGDRMPAAREASDVIVPCDKK